MKVRIAMPTDYTNLLPKIRVSKDCPETTIFVIPQRREKETDEEFYKRCGVIKNVKVSDAH